MSDEANSGAADEKAAMQKAAKAFSRLGASKGGKARAEKLSPEERSEIAKNAVKARWARIRAKDDPASIDELEADESIEAEIIAEDSALPIAKYKGVIDLQEIGGQEIPCYVLEGEQRVIGRTSFTEMLTGIKGGGGLEKYLGVHQLRKFIDLEDVQSRMIPFRLPEVAGLERQTKGIPHDLAIDICRGFVNARDAYLVDPSGSRALTSRQMEMAMIAGMFLSACAKVGLAALIDEATGYQHDRARDALQVKLRAYLADEMRKWEKTFPDELWLEFGRLTNWKGSVTQRPKYWGNLVTELIYEYLDSDVTVWLKENKPKPVHGRNWHQSLSKEYGLRKLIEHIWTVIGIAKASRDMGELRNRMEAIFGKSHFQNLLSLKFEDEKSAPKSGSPPDQDG